MSETDDKIITRLGGGFFVFFKRLGMEDLIYMHKTKFIPICHKLNVDTETPISIFMKLAHLHPVYLLESVERGEQVGRYSFIGLDPILIFKYFEGKGVLENTTTGEKKMLSGQPMELIEDIIAGFVLDQPDDYPPFFGGLVGYLGYEFIFNYEDIQRFAGPGEKQSYPECYLLLCQTVLIYDHAQQSLKVVVLTEDGNNKQNNAQKIMLKIKKSLEKSVLNFSSNPCGNIEVKSNFTKKEFINCVNMAKEYIRAGDIFQVVLSQRFQVLLTRTPFSVYRSLRSLNPSPYMYFLNFEEVKIIGSSPEMLVKVEERQVETRPIAGTRPRGKNAAEDERLARQLLNDEKERAEHIMLVDLGRNDIGRVAAVGSVETTQFMGNEKYSHVMHMVSSVKGKLAANKTTGEALKSCFPAGTVSGAPKIRAMEIIAELEPTPRGVYAGAILYYGLTGNMDSCIAIRTIVIHDEYAYVQAGAGIVNDSSPEMEYLETCNKARAMLMALGVEIEKLDQMRGDVINNDGIKELSS